RTVLRERNWDRPAFALSVATSSDWQLGKAIKSIERRLGTALAATTSLNRQLVSAYTLRGAVSASQARGRGADKGYERALGFFRSALSVPGSDHNPLVKELEAHAQRKLQLETAEQAYEDFCALVQKIDNIRDRTLLTARAKRF